MLSLRVLFLFSSQGKTWKHVVTNTQFVSISVSSNDNIWGVGTDGAAYLRTEYEGHNELGKSLDAGFTESKQDTVAVAVTVTVTSCSCN